MKKQYKYIFSIFGMFSVSVVSAQHDASGISVDLSTAAVSEVTSEELQKNSSFEIGDALYGLLPGLHVSQKTGWKETPELIVRGGGSLTGTAPLIVVDGIPRDLKYINANDIESVKVLKDAAAVALWGTRGANGVILVTTKRGGQEKINVDANYTIGMDIPINMPEFVDSYTFAQMKNEALMYDGLAPAYDQRALDGFRKGSNADLYPNTDWLGKGLRNHTLNNQFNISFRGGGKKLRYFSSVNYKNDYGILNSDLAGYNDRYNSQMKRFDLSARVNLDVDITSYTRASLSMYGIINEENRPRTGEQELFASLYNVPSAAFPDRTTNGYWGGDNIFKKNPLALIADYGYFKTNLRMLQSNLRIFQDLSLLTKGLSVELGVAYDNSAVFHETGSKNYNYETSAWAFDPVIGMDGMVKNLYGDNSALSIDNSSLESQFMRSMLDAIVKYERSWNKHFFNASAKYEQLSYTAMGRNSTRKRQSYIAAAGYNYGNRYMVDFVANYAGTSVLPDGDKYRFYPTVSAAWVLSNEKFLKKADMVDFMKLRLSWGRTGNDNIGYDLDERFWISGDGYRFGSASTGVGGRVPGNLPVTNLTIEQAEKYNAGIDLKLFGGLSFSADAYYDKRTGILIATDKLYSSVLGTGVPQQNIGAIDNMGLEFALGYEGKTQKGFEYYAKGTFSFIDSEIIENGDGYLPYSYLYTKGNRYGQCYGLEAIGFFKDEQEIAESPIQTFSKVRPGDVKYKDRNGDKKIDQYDVAPIGNSTLVPAMTGGLMLGFNYKGFGVDLVIQGAAKYSRMLNTQSVYQPLRNNNSNLSKWYLEDKVRWTEDTKDIANMPRLSTLDNPNNYQNSTLWLADASFLKLRNVNIYYNFPIRWIKNLRLNKLQVYLRGNNLVSLDHIKYLNCEDLSVGYPDMMSLFAGINVNF